MSIAKEGTVTAMGVSKNGKPTVTVDGKLYYSGRCTLTDVKVGDRISFEASSFGTRGDLWGLDSWGKVSGAVGSTAPPASHPRASDDAEMRFISNCVGQAIAAGTIEKPDEIDAWFQAARDALKNEGFET
jgi:hypothetical protein